MNTYRDVAQLWDLSQPLNFSHLPEDDFLSVLQQQYPHHASPVDSNSNGHDALNPQSIANPTPSSEDSSPSPPNSYYDGQTGAVSDDQHDPTPKRKASDGGLEEGGPNQKAQHTLNSNKKGSNVSAASVPSRRKSTGSGTISTKDESRLLKRKEQNRAAQRAFRERKEKHVKDLEDQVAVLEAKNEQAMTENDNLRDLLNRLQTENVALKQQQSSFTFSVPKNAASSLDTQNRAASSFMDPSIFTPSPATSSRTPTVLSSPITIDSPSKYSNPLDWTSLSSFDPSVLNILDESPQATATSGAMSMDFGFDTSSDALLGFPYTTIASNPAFFSLASTFDPVTPPQQSDLASPPSSSANPFSFDFNGLTSWPTSNQSVQDPSLNDLFAGYMSPSNTTDYNPFLANTPELAHVASSGASSVSSASSPSELLQTPVSEGKPCPKTRDACQQAIKESGLSPFAPPSQPSGIGLPAILTKTMDSAPMPTISCSGGSKLPKTQQSDDNVEVMAAWKTVTSHPKFKEADMNELCSEFSAKARCDGTKVVLEPQGVNHILEAISKI